MSSSQIADKIEALGWRHQVLAGNIANASTPNYRPKDVVFATQMAEQALSLSRSDPNHLPLTSTAAGGGSLALREMPMQPNADGSWVDVDVERANLMSNANHLQGLMRAATHYLRMQQIATS